MLKGLNHITFAVSDLSRSVEFYTGVLGGEVKALWSTGAYVSLGHTWICLSLDEQASRQLRSDYSHVAFSVDDDDLIRMKLLFEKNGIPIWKKNESEGASLYFLDPDGHKLELHVGTLQSRLRSMGARDEQNTNECGSAV